MRCSVSQKLDFVLLKLLLFSVLSHFTKKFLILSHFMKIKSDSVSSHWKKSDSVSSHKKKSDSVSFHQKKTDSVSFYKKKILFCFDSVLNQNQNETENSDSDNLKWVKEDRVIIISCYHFLCKSESENSVSFQFCFVSFHQIEVWFCLISQKMNLVLFHLTEKKFEFISLKLLSFSVSFHLMKKNSVLFHLTEKKSHLILILTWNRTESEWEILILAVSLESQVNHEILHQNCWQTAILTVSQTNWYISINAESWVYCCL